MHPGAGRLGPVASRSALLDPGSALLNQAFERAIRVGPRQAGGLPFATHLAETPAERDFLEHHQGEFRRMWEQVGH